MFNNEQFDILLIAAVWVVAMLAISHLLPRKARNKILEPRRRVNKAINEFISDAGLALIFGFPAIFLALTCAAIAGTWIMMGLWNLTGHATNPTLTRWLTIGAITAITYPIWPLRPKEEKNHDTPDTTQTLY